MPTLPSQGFLIGRPRNGPIAEWAIVAVGCAFLVVVSADFVVDAEDPLVDFLERAIPLAVALGFVVFGVRLRRRGVSRSDISAVALGAVAGGSVFALFEVLTLAVIALEQPPPEEPSHVVFNAVALGLAAGGFLTLQYRRLDRRNDDLRRYKTIVEAVGDPVYTLDREGRYTFVNESFVEQTGYDREALLGEHVSMVVPETERRKAKERIRRLMEDGGDGTATFEMERRTADGRRVTVENNVALLRGPDGEFQRTAGVLRDITERKEWERRLEELAAAIQTLIDAETSEELYEQAVDTTNRVLGFGVNSVRTLDPESGHLVAVARSAESAERLGERRPYDPETTPAGRAFRTGEVVVDDVPEDDPHGRNPLSTAVYAPIGEYGVLSVGTWEESFGDDDLRLVGILGANVGAARSRLQREAELRERNERLDEFASIVSHDLRNPLNVLIGSLDLAAESGDSAYFERCHRAADRMDALVEDLLTLARTKDRELAPEAVDLADLVAACWETVDTGEATLEVRTTRTVMADAGRLRQVVENLFRNAVEHGGDSVTVRVGDRPAGFYVEDDGSGIPESERTEVFDAGYSGSDDGTGLGLHIVRRAVDAHGWDVRVTEGAEGGAQFEVTGVETV